MTFVCRFVKDIKKHNCNILFIPLQDIRSQIICIQVQHHSRFQKDKNILLFIFVAQKRKIFLFCCHYPEVIFFLSFCLGKQNSSQLLQEKPCFQRRHNILYAQCYELLASKFLEQNDLNFENLPPNIKQKILNCVGVEKQISEKVNTCSQRLSYSIVLSSCHFQMKLANQRIVTLLYNKNKIFSINKITVC